MGYRERLEKEKQVALAYMQRGVLEQQQKLGEAHRVLDDAREELRREAATGEIDLSQIRRQKAYLSGVARQVVELQERLHVLEVELSTRRDEAIRARKDRKVLELLKRRRRASWMQQRERVEQSELDELAGGRDAAGPLNS